MVSLSRCGQGQLAVLFGASLEKFLPEPRLDLLLPGLQTSEKSPNAGRGLGTQNFEQEFKSEDSDPFPGIS